MAGNEVTTREIQRAFGLECRSSATKAWRNARRTLARLVLADWSRAYWSLRDWCPNGQDGPRELRVWFSPAELARALGTTSEGRANQALVAAVPKFVRLAAVCGFDRVWAAIVLEADELAGRHGTGWRGRPVRIGCPVE